MAALYADEDFAYAVVEELRRLGHDVLTVQEAGQANQGIPDEKVLAYASQRRRIVLTHNRRDFIYLHPRAQPHPGIIVCTRDRDIAALAARIHEVLANSPILDDQLTRIHRPSRP